MEFIANNPYLTAVAMIISIISPVISGVYWYLTRRHANRAKEDLGIISNFRHLEALENANSEIEKIKRNTLKKFREGALYMEYGAIEKSLEKIWPTLPKKNEKVSNQIKDVVKIIRGYINDERVIKNREVDTVVDKLTATQTELKNIIDSIKYME